MEDKKKRTHARKKTRRSRSRKARSSPSSLDVSPLRRLGAEACAAAGQLITLQSVQYIILAMAFVVLVALVRGWSRSAPTWVEPAGETGPAHLGLPVSDPLKGWRKVVKKMPDGTYEDYFFNKITGEKSTKVPMEMVDGEIRGGVWQRFVEPCLAQWHIQ